MKNPLLQINQPADVDLGRNGSLNLGIRWKTDLAGRFTEGFLAFVHIDYQDQRRGT